MNTIEIVVFVIIACAIIGLYLSVKYTKYKQVYKNYPALFDKSKYDITPTSIRHTETGDVFLVIKGKLLCQKNISNLLTTREQGILSTFLHKIISDNQKRLRILEQEELKQKYKA